MLVTRKKLASALLRAWFCAGTAHAASVGVTTDRAAFLSADVGAYTVEDFGDIAGCPIGSGSFFNIESAGGFDTSNLAPLRAVQRPGASAARIVSALCAISFR